MVKVYYRQVKSKKRTIEQVPDLWRDEVQALIDADEEE